MSDIGNRRAEVRGRESGGRRPKVNPNMETRSPKQVTRTKNKNSKLYDLEDRAVRFAKNVRAMG
jgi:hypothetical protein